MKETLDPQVHYKRWPTLGQDCEFFLFHEEEFVPAFQFLPVQASKITGTNTLSGCEWGIFRDGLAVEVNTSPTDCRAWLWEDVKVALAHAKKLASATLEVPREELSWSTTPYVTFPSKLKKSFPKDCRILGCNPTFDAYTKGQNHPQVQPMRINYRTSGSHFHMGWPGWKFPTEAWSPFIKIADLVMGLPATYIFGDELEFKRRKLYGRAGEFRFQSSYGGIEYRALSSRIFNHPAIHSLFSGLWKYVVGGSYVHLWNTYWDPAWEDDLQLAINEGKGMDKLLPLSCLLINAAGRNYTGLDQPFTPEVFSKLRKMNDSGAFPDGGVGNVLYAEAHFGWGDYRRDKAWWA